MDELKLRNCPFCGDKQHVTHVELSNGLHYVECKRCGAAPHRLGAWDYEMAVKYWNSVNRWIPVEDALPEIGYSVLVIRQTESNTRYVRIASRQDDCWMDNTDKYGKPNPHPVIAWMTMPDAYEPPEKE